MRLIALGAASLCGALIALPALAQQTSTPAAARRAAAPEPYKPVGALHFLGLSPLETGLFFDPASVTRADGRASAMALTVQGRLWQVAEGDIRWSWEKVDADCAARTWRKLTSDHYNDDGSWVSGFALPIFEPTTAAIPLDETLLAYLCEGVQPEGMQAPPSEASAVAGIKGAFAGR